MRKLLFPLFSLFLLTSLVLAACGTPVAPTPITVEVTRIVTSEAPAPAFSALAGSVWAGAALTFFSSLLLAFGMIPIVQSAPHPGAGTTARGAFPTPGGSSSGPSASFPRVFATCRR